MPSEIRRIEKLDTLEVSLVPRGANKKRFALRKSQEFDMSMESVIQAVLEGDLDNEAQIDTVLKAAKLSDKAQAAVKSMVKLAQGFKDEMPENLMKLLGDLSGYGATEKGCGDKVKKGEIDTKDLPAEVKAQLETLWKAHEDMQKEKTALEATLKAERDVTRTKEFVAKAATEFANLPGVKADEFGPVLKAMADADPKAADALMGVLKAADLAIKESAVLTQVGRATSQDNKGESAWTQIEKLAEAAVQKSEKPMPRASAIDMVLKSAEGKALYQQYLQENPSQIGAR